MGWNSFRKPWQTMDNLHYRRTFDLENENEIPGKNLLRVVKFQNLGENIVMFRKYSLTKLVRQFSHILCCVLKLPFSAQKW